jgi:predicted metal-dependent hydrolase
MIREAIMATGEKVAPKKAKRKRREYSKEKRAEILAAAATEHLTAAAVQKRFGVKPVTYYSWRKKTGASKSRSARTVVKKPAHCLEYLVVHELVHLSLRRHDRQFLSTMNNLLPSWRSRREELNRAPLSHERWSY